MGFLLKLLVVLSISLQMSSGKVVVSQKRPSDPKQDEEFLYGTFPDGFLWGFATASYQIEGGIINIKDYNRIPNFMPLPLRFAKRKKTLKIRKKRKKKCKFTVFKNVNNPNSY